VIESWQPEVLLSDMMMPEKDGLYLMRELRHQGHNICAIALSAYDNEGVRKKAFEVGFRDYLMKPVDTADIVKAIIMHCASQPENNN
jgi:CheY-like chemotaxis protein